MFKRLAKSGLVKFWPVQPQRIAPRLREASLSNAAYSNDNLPGLRRPAATGRRRAPTPALACHWFDRGGRLECRWQADGDAPVADAGEPRFFTQPSSNCLIRGAMAEAVQSMVGSPPPAKAPVTRTGISP